MPPEATATPEPVAIETYTIQPNGVVLKVSEQQRTKGKSAGKLVYGFADEQVLADAPKVFGAENYKKWLLRQLNRILNDAATDAANKENGIVSDTGLATALTEQLTAATRKHGEHVAQLREKRDEIMAELQPLLVSQLRKEKLTEQQQIDLISLMERWETIVSQIEAKERKGKTAKSS